VSLVFIVSSGFLSSSAASIDFASVPQTFTHLQARIWGKGTYNNAGSGLSVTCSFTGYTPLFRHRLVGNGSNPISQNYSTSFGSIGSVPDVNADASIFGANIFDFLDYTSTTKNKTLRYIGGFDRNGSGEVTLGSALASGGAISNLNFSTDGNWAAGTRIDLYGITTSSVTGA
jgi:hypothetical protein